MLEEGGSDACSPSCRDDRQQRRGHGQVLPGWQREHVATGWPSRVISGKPDTSRITEARYPCAETLARLDWHAGIIEPLAFRHYLVAAVKSPRVSARLDLLGLHDGSQHRLQQKLQRNFGTHDWPRSRMANVARMSKGRTQLHWAA